MSSLFEALAQQMGGGMVREMSQKLGTDPAQTSTALSAALPILVSALARNAATPQGAEALGRAIGKDHDGSLLDNLGGLLGGGAPSRAADGNGILGHILGDRRGAVEQGIAKASGLDMASVGKLLMMAAPMIMAMLGKTQRQQGLDAGGLASMLGREQQNIDKHAPSGVLGSLLDQNGDGNIGDDLGRLGMGVLGRFLSGK